jgi:RNA polymerase sigma factor (sigma-70 family)
VAEHEENFQHVIGHLFRHEAGKMAAVLTRLLGFSNLDTAEDIVQETLLQAMTTWKFHGVPANPSAWLYTVAKNKTVDVVRKNKRIKQHQSKITNLLESEWTLTSTVSNFFLENEIEDSQLRVMFACCHPLIAYESQIALTLKTLCGLSVQEIANGFLTNEETIGKRIYRAKEKIKEEKIALDVPFGSELTTREEAILKTLYLLFNEGYNSSHPDVLIRKDLCEEAMRLCILLTRNKQTNLPEANALLSLMCLQASRFDARLDKDGNIILLNNQDRSQWNEALIKVGLMHLEFASTGNRLTEYHLEAAIASCHALAKNFEETNWKEIYKLYELLLKIKPGAIIEMNKAVALGYAVTVQEGLNALLKIKGLEENYLYHTALADFYFKVFQHQQAYNHYTTAKTLTNSKVEKELLDKKMSLTKK